LILPILFRIFRITLLLVIFIGIAFYSKTQKLKSRSWSEPLQVIIYPINGEGSPVVDAYISQLDNSVFAEIDRFFQHEAEHYSLFLENPTQTELGATMSIQPTPSPNPRDSMIKTILWGVKFRYWAFKNTPDDDSNFQRIRVFLHYHEAVDNKELQHSLGLDKGLLAIVHAFASKDQEQQNNIVIAHELLHTVGATDKYDRNNQPIFPDGYADPQQIPLFPQIQAEIMAAKIPLSDSESKMAESLSQCIITDKTAREINWLQENAYD